MKNVKFMIGMGFGSNWVGITGDHRNQDLI